MLALSEDSTRRLPELLPEVGPPTKSAPDIYYSADLAARICDWVSKGKTLSWVSQQSEMPCYATLQRWASRHPELSRQLQAIKAARARHFEDAAIEAAESADGKDADRLRVETYKWAAEVNDPLTYGKKVAHSGEVGGALKIVKIITGFGELPEALRFPTLNADGTMVKEVKSGVADGKEDRSDGGCSHEEDTRGSTDEVIPGGGSAVSS